MKRRFTRALALLLTAIVILSAVDIRTFAAELEVDSNEEIIVEGDNQSSDDVCDEFVEEEQIYELTEVDDEILEAEDEQVDEVAQFELNQSTEDFDIEDEMKDQQNDDVLLESTENESTESIFCREDIRYKFIITSTWDSGYNAVVRVENNSGTNVENWEIEMVYDGAIDSIWNASVSSHEDGKYIIKNNGWNKDIPDGEFVEFGISAHEAFADFPSSFGMLSGIAEKSDGDYVVDYQVNDNWGAGFTASLTVTNTSAATIEDWILEFDFDGSITNMWNGTIISHEGNHYEIKNNGYNANIASGASIVLGFQGINSIRGHEPENYRLLSFDDRVISDNQGKSEDLADIDSVSGNSVSENTVSENSVSENTVSENSVSSNDVDDSLLEGDVSTYIDATDIVSEVIVRYIKDHGFTYDDAGLIVDNIELSFPNLVSEARVSSGNTVIVTLTSGFEFSFQVVDTSDLDVMCRGGMPSQATIVSYQEDGADFIDENGVQDIQEPSRNVKEIGSDKILLWAPFDNAWRGADETKLIESIVSDSDYAGKLTVISDEAANVESIKSFSEYGLIIISSHGSEGKWIVTGEDVTDVDAHSDDVLDKTAGIAVIYDVFTDTYIRKWQVNDAWISKNVIGSFPDSIIINNSCESTKERPLVDAFLGSGARTYFGYSANVANEYIIEKTDNVLRGLLLEGFTAQESYEITVDTTYDGGAMEIYGFGNAIMPRKVYSTIYNNSFESDGEGWNINDDANASRGYCTFLSSLYGITPTDGERMAALGTNNEPYGYSCIEQTVEVPEGAKYILFDYNILEAYDPEYISNGIVDVKHGNEICLDLMYWNDKANSWYGAEKSWYNVPITQTNAVRWENEDYGKILIEMPDAIIQGCDNVYMSDWQRASYDISRYAGTTMEIKIYVWGGWYSSGAIESLVLIDNIRFDSEQKLTPSILNTSFENGMQGWGVDSYTYAGRYNPSKCLILEEYAGIKPTDGNKMLALMTNEENVADIYMHQTIYIPKNVSAITFDYNVLDSFDADNFASVGNGSRLCVRQDKDFNYTFSAFDRGLYGGCEHYCGGKIWGSTPLIYAEDVTINGCDNVYMSGWQEGVYDVTELAGSTVKFQLDFSDARRSDYVYASLILIDNIRFVYDGEEEGFKPVSDEYDSQIVRAIVENKKSTASNLVSQNYLTNIGWKYGDVSKKEVRELNYYFNAYGIVDELSIRFFLATLFRESDRGNAIVEDYREEDNHSYKKTESGVGYIQLTSRSAHLNYLEYKGDSFEGEDTTGYIAEKYSPWDVSCWFWAIYPKTGNGYTLNSYVSMYRESADLYSLFLASQFFVVGFPNEYGAQLTQMREGTLDWKYKDGMIVLLDNDGNELYGFDAPDGWEVRSDAYDACMSGYER